MPHAAHDLYQSFLITQHISLSSLIAETNPYIVPRLTAYSVPIVYIALITL